MGTIPANAKRVFKGEIFEVWQWEQKMFDGSHETFEMVKRPYTVQVLATENDKILIADEEQPHHKRGIGLLGGRIDEGEEPLEAAKRELLEEAGLHSDSWDLWRIYEPMVKMDFKIIFYIARNCKKIQEPKLEVGEKIMIKNITFDEFIEAFTTDAYWQGQFACDLIRLKLDSRLDEFRKKLFP